MRPTRRHVLAAAATSTAGLYADTSEPIPIIDTHLHLYDPTRPQGAPFPKTPNPQPFLPKHYQEAATPLGIAGGIKVESSPWVEDNLWVLMVIETEPMIVGVVGCLDPTKPDFREYLERYRRNKLFLGIRYGNVWEGHNLPAVVDKPDVLENMRAFAQTSLTLEVANPRVDLMRATVRLTDKVPELRVVLGHLQALQMPQERPALNACLADLRELKNRRAYAKVSWLPGYRPGNADTPDPSVYKPGLDRIWDIFGEDQVVYAGRNKPALNALQTYFGAKGRQASEKFFWKNSVAAYRWIRRDPKQPQVPASA